MQRLPSHNHSITIMFRNLYNTMMKFWEEKDLFSEIVFCIVKYQPKLRFLPLIYNSCNEKGTGIYFFHFGPPDSHRDELHIKSKGTQMFKM